MDLSMFDIATIGLLPNSANFGGIVTWENPQPCKKNIFYAWFDRAFFEQVHFKTTQLLLLGLLFFVV